MPLHIAKVIFKTDTESSNYSYTINRVPPQIEADTVKVNVSYQQQQVSVPAGDFQGIRYDLNYDGVGTEKAQIDQMEETFVLVKDVGIVYHRVTNTTHDSFKSLLTDYNITDKLNDR